MEKVMKEWHDRQYDKRRAKEFAREERIDEVFAALLMQRGLDEHDAVKEFVRPNLTHLHDPFLLPDMREAVDRILLAKQRGERVTIFGDYDADGLTSTAVVYTCLQSMGLKVDCYVPHRMNEGYGLNRDALEEIKERGTTLVITVDLGVTALEETQIEGMDFVITDHHQPLEQLPQACAVVDPKQEDCQSPFRELAGVGVAFKLVWALQYERPLEEILREWIDLVCLGTIADIVPLRKENRFFAKCGLQYITHTKRPGLRALVAKSGYKTVDSTAVGFGLAPRINAAGRMGNARLALELLLTDDEQKGEQLAEELCKLNLLRQQTEQEIYEQAVKKISASATDPYVLVVSGEGWHQGVIGIVASKLMNQYDKPVVLLSIEDGIAHGSARSVEGFPIFDALYECEHCLIRFGGHDKAAGMTLRAEDIPAFTEGLNQVAQAVTVGDIGEGLTVDLRLPPSKVTLELAQKMTFFEPFGEGNPQPVFVLEDMEIAEATPTRDGKHLRLKAKKEGHQFSCIGFGMGQYQTGARADLAFCVSVNAYRGQTSLNLILKDIH
ncbi:MAG: single-stranded-DNA-specific exonuclease RecJ [Ruminococcaceae bacterium]|nr:single-stranded-DNA-specific exonuclease RecJ [Oscillospiraceae bacterium]